MKLILIALLMNGVWANPANKPEANLPFLIHPEISALSSKARSEYFSKLEKLGHLIKESTTKKCLLSNVPQSCHIRYTLLTFDWSQTCRPQGCKKKPPCRNSSVRLSRRN